MLSYSPLILIIHFCFDCIGCCRLNKLVCFSFSDCFAAGLISPVACMLLLIFEWVMYFFADLQNLWTCLSLTCLVLFPLLPAVNICRDLGHWSYLRVQSNIYFLRNLGFPLSASLHLLHSRMELHWHAANWRNFIL